MLRSSFKFLVGFAALALVFGAVAADEPGAKSGIDCASLPDSVGPVPAEVVSECGLGTAPAWSVESDAPTDMAYAVDIYPNNQTVSHLLNDFPGQTVVGPTPGFLTTVDFDPTATTLYAMNAETFPYLLGTIDTATGIFTAINECQNSTSNFFSGMTIDPVTGTAYATDTSYLYTIDLTDPTNCNPVLVGPMNNPGGLMIEIAMNASGEMYGHDIGDDVIYSIDKATGAATAIGPTGYDANYAQGMDFDNEDGTLYIYLLTLGLDLHYGTVDLATGAVTPLATNDPFGEFIGAVRNTAGGTSEPLVCNGAAVGFDVGPPPDWTVIDNEGNGLVWADLATCGEVGNFTNGSGDCACASSDIFGAAGYDTEMWSPPFDTTGQFIVQLGYTVNYQNLASLDFLDVDVSTDGGGSWDNVLSWNEDHGGFRAPPGEDVMIDISAVAANQPSVIIRWHYYNPNSGDDYDWYAQIDDASLFCDIPVELESFTIE